MLKEAKASVKLYYICDKCKIEYWFSTALVEVENLDEFRQAIMDTMNSEGCAILDDHTWICPNCVEK